jgi:hypothetical protein
MSTNTPFCYVIWDSHQDEVFNSDHDPSVFSTEGLAKKMLEAIIRDTYEAGAGAEELMDRYSILCCYTTATPIVKPQALKITWAAV